MIYRFFAVFFLLCVWTAPAWAITIIRDAETESVIRKIATPIFRAAGLSPENVHIYIINDPQINAFVTGGMNLFIHTGLLMEFDDASIVQGVIAHETGHIAGGHLARNSDRYRGVTFGTTLSYVLGAAAAASGSPETGIAIIQGGQHIAQREVLQYSRENEEAADQAGLSFLTRTHNSPKGLLTLLEFLNRRERMMYGKLDPYAQTHPLSRERIMHVQQNLSASPYRDAVLPTDIQAMYTRAYAKLNAFLKNPETTLKRYSAADTAIGSRYARAIALYKKPDINEALVQMNRLIAEYPNDPYFHEMKGQIFFENGRSSEAVESYKKALGLLPSPLIRLGLAQAEIAASDNAGSKGHELLTHAVTLLHQAQLQEPDNSAILEQLAIAHGKRGEEGMASLVKAEQALLQGDGDAAIRYASLAEKSLPQNSPSYLKLHDIISSAKALPPKEGKKR